MARRRSLDDIIAHPPEVPADPTADPGKPAAPRLMTVPELAAHFRRGESTIWSWRSKAPGLFSKVDGRTKADPVAVERWRTAKATPPGFVPPLATSAERVKAAKEQEEIKAPFEQFLDLDGLDGDGDEAPETLEQELRAIGQVSRKLKRLLDAINLKALSDPRMAGTFLKLVSGYTTNSARAIKIREALEEERKRAGLLIPAADLVELLATIGDEHRDSHDRMVEAVTEEAIAVLNEAGIGAAFDSDVMESRIRARARALLNDIADSIERETVSS